MPLPSTVDFILEQIQTAGSVRSKAMFGGYCLYCDEKVVALVCDDKLFVKITPAGKLLLQNWTEKPAYPGAKNSFVIAAECWDDAEWLSELIRLTASELPVPKRQRKK